MSTQVNRDILKGFPLFENLSDEHLSDISAICKVTTYAKGEMIFWEGDEGDALYLVLSGVVQVYQDNQSRDIILSIFRDGDFFGEMALLQNEKVRSASARAIEKSTLCVLKKKYFNELVITKSEILLHILETTLDRLRKANKLIADLTIHDARKRIGRLLLRLAEQHGASLAKGTLIDIKFTHQHLADMTGTARETVTKILLELQQDQVIRINKKQIMVNDIETLKTIADTY